METIVKEVHRRSRGVREATKDGVVVEEECVEDN